VSGWHTARERLKAALEHAAVALGVARLGRFVHRRRTWILAYHNVVPRGGRAVGERALHLDQEGFGAQLDLLIETVSVIPLGAVDEPATSDEIPHVVLTLDDAYSGALTAGVQEIVSRGLPATIFVPPGCLGGPPFWWDALAESFGGELPDRVRSEALARYGGDAASIFEAFRLHAIALPDHARPADVGLLEAAWSQSGISIASHAWSHPNLAAIPSELVVEELTRSLAWLRERRPDALPWLSYPYGLHNVDVRRRAAEVGYLGALQVSGGWLPRSPGDRYAIPRLNIPAGLSLDGFAIRLGGFLCR
jgi:peptidoglycan/xylan/chitin deacetylase (PgdA/CDA1 family)